MPTLLPRERFGDFLVHPTNPKSLSVEVEPGVILSNSGAAITGIPDSVNYGSAQILNASATVGPFVPPAAGNVRRDLITVDINLGIHTFTGVEIAAPGPGVVPTIPSNLIPLAIISLISTTTEIDTDEIQDIRPLLVPHQDRSRQIRIESILPGTIPPVSGTSGNFTTLDFNAGIDSDVKFSLTVPDDFDYNREFKLYLRGYSSGAGVGGDAVFQSVAQRVAAGAGAGAFPPAASTTATVVTPVNDDSSAEVHTLQIAASAGSTNYALRVLLPGDVLAFVISRQGTDILDTYTGVVSIVEFSFVYNLGYSVYPG